MKKSIRFIIITICFICTISFAGCTVNYTREDIIQYAKEKFNLKKVFVSEEPVAFNDGGYTDKIWTVIDEDNDIIFHVKDDYYYGSESVRNSLKDDYDDAVFTKYYNELEKRNNVEYKEYAESGMYIVTLTCRYKNKKELQECIDSLKHYNNFYHQKGFFVNVFYYLILDLPIKNKVEMDYYSYGSDQGTLDDINPFGNNAYDNMLVDYFKFGLAYQDAGVLSEMTEKDKKAVLSDEGTELVYKRLNDKDEKVFYNDFIGYYGDMSFGALYMLLKEEKFEVSGSSSHFTVTNKNGEKYEFSYSFDNELYKSEDGNDKDKYGYYYLKNGKKEKMDAYFCHYFSPKEIKEMFDIDIGIKENRFLDD